VIATDFALDDVRTLEPAAADSRSLGELLTRQLLTPAGQAFRFRHAMIRDQAYAGLTKIDRAELHRRYAGVLEGSPGALGVEVDEAIGYHLERAARLLHELRSPTPDDIALAARAGGMLATAGRRAMARGDATTAIGLFTRASELVTDARLRAEMLGHLAIASLETGRYPEAMALWDRADAAVADLDDPRLRARSLVGRVRVDLAAAPDRAVMALPGVERAIVDLEAMNDPAWAAQGRFAQANILALEMRSEDLRVALLTGLEHSRRLGAPDPRIEAMLAGFAAFGPSPADEGIGICEGILADHPEASVQRGNTLANLGLLMGFLARFDEGRRLILEGCEMMSDLGMRGSQFGAPGIRAQQMGLLEELAGDLDASAREFRQGYDATRQIGDRTLMSSLALWLADVLLAAGQVDEAEQLSAAGREVSGEHDRLAQIQWLIVRGKLLALRGSWEEGEEMARSAAELIDPNDSIEKLRILIRLSETLEIVGKPADAAEVAGRALAFGRAKRAPAMVHWAERVLVRIGPQPERP
jgi:tetratricopeptide (TPR) repeat protein